MKQFLEKLLKTPSPSGYEWAGLEVWKSEMEPEFSLAYSDGSGNLGYSIGTGSKTIILSGHIDEICLAVRYIDDSGFLIPCQMAGVDKKVLPGHSVIVIGDNGEQIHGVVQKNPIHLEFKGKEKPLDFDDLKIDLGVRSKEDVESLGVHVGSLIVLEREINLDFGKNMLHGNSLDDKSGVYVISEVLKALKKDLGEWRSKYTVIGIACIGEESGLLGARRIMNKINPEISIDIDVTHACDTGQFKREKYGDIKLGEGVVLEYGQDKSRRLNKIFQEVADQEKINYQRSVSGIGGTNTKEFYLGGDCETTLLSLPLLSMHTPIETMSWDDIDGAIKLLTETIKSRKL